MQKVVTLVVCFVAGAGLVFTLARFVYRPPTRQQAAPAPMTSYINKQKQILQSFGSSEFDAKASQQLEQFTSDANVVTDTAKNNPKHTELQQFAVGSTYSWGYNHEGILIIEENLGLRPKHEGKHCDSVGSC